MAAVAKPEPALLVVQLPAVANNGECVSPTHATIF